MNTLDQFQAFLYKAQNASFEEKRDNLATIYTKYTKKGDSSKADYRDVTAMKLGAAGYTPLGGQAHVDEYAPGTEIVVKYKKLTIAVITPEELEADIYNGGRIDEDKARVFATMNDDMVESMNWAYEIICTDFQLRGTSTTATAFWQGAGRDGLAMFSTSHVTTKGVPVTWSNSQTSAPLGALTLMEGVTMLENIPDETGRPQGSIKRIGIIHGRYWSWYLPTLLKATSQPETANTGTPNALNARYDKVEYVPILNPYLGATETSWQLIDLDNHKQMFFQKEKPTMNRDIEPRTGNKIVRCRSRVAAAFLSAKGVLKNAGV